jgi:hypothetical protein
MKRPVARAENAMAVRSNETTRAFDKVGRSGRPRIGYDGLDLAARAVFGGDMGWCAENDRRSHCEAARGISLRWSAALFVYPQRVDKCGSGGGCCWAAVPCGTGLRAEELTNARAAFVLHGGAEGTA